MPLNLSEFAATPRVSDGAWGTQLQARGLEGGTCAELWNVDNPGAVEDVARSYVGAGSDVILTNTFGANRFALEAHGAGDRAAELCEAGAAISRRAAGEAVRVFGSIGPSGKVVMMGEVGEEELSSAFAEAAEALVRGGVDAIVLETFNELAEAKLALTAARGAVDVPVISSMTFSSGPDRTRTMMGDAPSDLAAMAAECGAAGVGANCGVGPDVYVKVAAMLGEATELPVWIKPNAGMPEVRGGRTVFPMGAAEFAAYAPRILSAGASFVGGCCGTGPEYIRAVRDAVDAGA
ncbi:MAG: homocysteine S-methyltransferase family protein [Planctomycetota bacterium]